MLPNLSKLALGAGAEADQHNLFVDMVDEAAKAARKTMIRRRPPPPPPERPPLPPQPAPLPPLLDDYDDDDESLDLDDGYESDDYLNGEFESPVLPVDIEIDPEVLENTIGNLTKLLEGGVTRKETMELLVEIRSSAAELWEALVECYRENARMAETQRAAKGDGATDTPKKSNPVSMQKILVLLTALMALISFKGPELITSVDKEPMRGNGGVYTLRTQPGVRMLPTTPALPALPPPDVVVMPKIVRREGGRAGKKPNFPRRPTPRRSPVVAPHVYSTAPVPATPTPSSAPLAPVNAEWWSEYIERSLLALGVGVVGLASGKR